MKKTWILFTALVIIGGSIIGNSVAKYNELKVDHEKNIQIVESLNANNNELIIKLDKEIETRVQLEEENEDLVETIEMISRNMNEFKLSSTPTPIPTPTPTPKLTPTPKPTQAIAQTNLELLARIIYCEAGGEPAEDQLAVGQVVLNRSKELGMTLKETIYQRLGNGTYVFSPVASSKYSRRSYSKESEKIAARLLGGEVFTPVGKALYFCTIAQYNKQGWHYDYVNSGKGIITYKSQSTVYID